MKPADVFGIIVRVCGISLLVYSIWYLVFGVFTVAGRIPEQEAGDIAAYFISGFTFLIISLYLLRGAPHILQFSYPNQRKDDENKTV